MVDKKLIDYINDNLQKGHSLEEIRKFIVNYGWSEKDFDEAVLLASGSARKKPEKVKKPDMGGSEDIAGDKKKGHKGIIIALIILAIVIFVFLFVITDTLNFFSDLYPDTALPFSPFNFSMFS